MAKSKKTNAMRILERNKIQYTTYEYEVIENQTDGLTVAASIGKNPAMVFKTLVTRGNTREHFVFVVPVGKELDLKKAAKVSGQKKIDMIPMKELLQTTGYIHGGCSPVGMKKQFKTFFDASVLSHETMVCSGGKRGLQVEVQVSAMIHVVQGETAVLVK